MRARWTRPAAAGESICRMPIDLQHKVSTGPFAERWVGCDRGSGRELLVTIPRLSSRGLDDETKSRIVAAVRRYRGLIHPHICALVEVGFAESGQLIVAQELPRSLAEPVEGTLELPEGKHTLSVVPTKIAHVAAMNLRSIVLRPAEE